MSLFVFDPVCLIFFLGFYVAALSPLPASPLNLYIYTVVGAKGFLVLVPAALLACSTQYMLGRLFSRYLPGSTIRHLSVISLRLQSMSLWSYYLLRQSSLLPSKFVNLASGYAHYSFRNFLVSTLLSSVLSQAVYFCASAGMSKLQITNSLFSSSWTFASLISFISYFCLFLLGSTLLLRAVRSFFRSSLRHPSG